MADAWSGVVLTGGRSERMGRDKALLLIDGEAMAARVARALRAAGASEVVCVGGDLDGLRAQGLAAIEDDHPGAGPLGGLLTGLASATTPITVIAPCDLIAPTGKPFADLVERLAALDALAAVPIVDGEWRPLPAALRAAAHPALAEAFAEGERAVHRALERLDFVALNVGSLADVDTPEDLPGHR